VNVAIVVPTVKGREADLRRCVESYRRTAPDATVYIAYDHPSCGEAWLDGAKRAARKGFDYLHLTADDLEAHDGWLDIAVETVDEGFIPAPLVYQPDGTLESAGLVGFSMNGIVNHDRQPIEGTTVPFLTREMWDAIGMVPLHYCTDLWVSTVGRRHGWETVIRTGMKFTHYTAPAGRNYGRAGTDTQEYLRFVAELPA
jgi:hypothetical protein